MGCVYAAADQKSMTPPGPGNLLCSLPPKYVSTCRAACRPSDMAQTTND